MTTEHTHDDHDEHGWIERPGATIEIQWLTGDAAYGRPDAKFTATLLCVDRLGTCTYREGDRLCIAGAGSWRYVA